MKLAQSLQTKDQLTGGLEYLKKLNEKSPDWKEFESSSGIGVEVSLARKDFLGSSDARMES